jgi:acyl-CoA reductase-like NAD-dependent aldehyde dehydrogenase
MELPHIPALRLGKSYESLNTVSIADHRSGETLVEISQVNAGVIRRDMMKIANARAALSRLSSSELFAVCAKAADLFLESTLPLGDRGHTQSAGDYVAMLSRTSGLPHVMIRRNMDKIHSVLARMPMILKGLTRGMDPSVIDDGAGTQDGVPVAYYPTTQSLGLVMPSNSPAVNSLWLPAIALKIPVIIKPGREEPWTPFRLIQAFIAAGCPAEAFGFYPTTHDGAASILEKCDRSLIFGDKNTTDLYAHDPRVQPHGPGFSKILIGEDQIENWRDYIDVIAASISDNGGRSCVNASAVIVPKYAAEIADALAQKLGPIKPTTPDDENARLSGFANTKMADYIDSAIDEDLKTAGATDVTAKYRDGDRKVLHEGGIYMRPTVVHCDSWDHPLANREFLCPYASVVEMPQADMLANIGPTLVVTAITKDDAWAGQLMGAAHLDRLNIGPVSTMKISWDQPHEGNLFEFLYKRRSYERAW